VVAQASDGTIETARGHLFGSEAELWSLKSGLGFDHLLKAAGGGASGFATTVANAGLLRRGTSGRSHRALFVMAGINGDTVKRSNALLGYGGHVSHSLNWVILYNIVTVTLVLCYPVTRPVLALFR
jgi:hypothetical protein